MMMILIIVMNQKEEMIIMMMMSMMLIEILFVSLPSEAFMNLKERKDHGLESCFIFGFVFFPLLFYPHYIIQSNFKDNWFDLFDFHHNHYSDYDDDDDDVWLFKFRYSIWTWENFFRRERKREREMMKKSMT